MTSKERVLERERQRGKHDAQEVQQNAESMTGTELYAADDCIPSFTAACKHKNMLERPVGFTCKSPGGRVVRLLQPYDSETYPLEPEDLPAQWGFKWSTDPSKAQPFIAISTSPYNEGECCTENGVVYRSKLNANVFRPSAYPSGWEVVEM
jgi:hypothetical protein